MAISFPEEPTYVIRTPKGVHFVILHPRETLEQALIRLGLKDVDLVWEPRTWARDTQTNEIFRF